MLEKKAFWLISKISMRVWERDHGAASPVWWRFLCRRIDKRWMLFVTALGILLCWDAIFSFLGCTKEATCGSGLLLRHLLRTFPNGENYESGKSVLSKAIDRNGVEMLEYFKDIDLETIKTGSQFNAGGFNASTQAVVQAAVSFNDSVVLVLSPFASDIAAYIQQEAVSSRQAACSYSSRVQTNALSVEEEFIRCDHPPLELQKALKGSSATVQVGEKLLTTYAIYGSISWKKVVYSWVLLDDQDAALLFVKGLVNNKRSTLPEGLECLYGNDTRTKVIDICQENVRCMLPPPLSRPRVVGSVVTLAVKDQVFPSVIRFHFPSLPTSLKPPNVAALSGKDRKPYFLCACTLVWNGAKFLKEWVSYHSHLGVERFFLYDNNSDDGLAFLTNSLQSYNLSRHSWPWLKTQEASFSHCAIRSASECLWVAFIDLDEFIFPKSYVPQRSDALGPPLHTMIKQYDAEYMGKLGQLKLKNYNFGPSGLVTLPTSGQMVNYICRMRKPRRFKSIVRTAAMDFTYCSRVHHFELKDGFVSNPTSLEDAIIHHYKYQAWEDFKTKFIRRAATFVTDWNQAKDMNSSDRTPGLGVEAVEPPNWAHQFCEIEDTALRDYVLNTTQLQIGGKLLWE